MAGYITDSTLIGLHDHKVRQYRIRLRVNMGMAVLLLLVVVWSFVSTKGKVSHRSVDGSGRCLLIPLDGPYRPREAPSPFFVSGFFGKIRVVSEGDHSSLTSPSYPPASRPQFNLSVVEAPETFFFDCGDYGHGAVDDDFGLPRVDPLNLLSIGRHAPFDPGPGLRDFDLRRPASIQLRSPVWPIGLRCPLDTVAVEGFLTLHASGRVTFDCTSQDYPGHGFVEAVSASVSRSVCEPAQDSTGQKITTCYRYRCLFVEGATSTVSAPASLSVTLSP